MPLNTTLQSSTYTRLNRVNADLFLATLATHPKTFSARKFPFDFFLFNGNQAWVQNYIPATFSACSTKILHDSCIVFHRLCWQMSASCLVGYLSSYPTSASGINVKVARWGFSGPIPSKFQYKLRSPLTNTAVEKLTTGLHQIKMKSCYDQGYNGIGVVIVKK